MDVPEYLDLDEIDFTDDLPYSSKSIPELCRRHDGQNDERQALAINWPRSAASHSGAGLKPTGIADVYSKFRPVKRVSPLKHQPEETQTQTETEGKSSETDTPSGKEEPSKSRGLINQALFGELEHYDLDMDEILDVPYIKCTQQAATLPRAPSAGNTHTLVHSESLSSGTQFCVLSPVMRKSKSADLRAQSLGFENTHEQIPDSKTGADGGHASRKQARGVSREVDEEAKKSQNILNIVRDGQISLLPHFAAENLELIRDEDGNNLLHVSAAQGHTDCLQHLTSLMGEDCLNERNKQQLTPAGLSVRNGHLECVRWMVSETEAIAELSCTREHPSLIHYAARYGQERVLLWLLQFMQEQAISLDEQDQNGNSAVHVAAQFGHLGCLQTLVEYGSNVTVQNQQCERASQCAERQGHTTCSRYLVVVETCMSLASQVVKLTKQLHEQTTARVALQNQLQLLLQTQEPNGRPPSPSCRVPPSDSWPEMTLTAEVAPENGQWVLKQKHTETDGVMRKLLTKDAAERTHPRDTHDAGAESGAGPGAGPMKRLGVGERRELKLARLKQIMQRSLSESDGDVYPPDETKHMSRPTQLPIPEAEEPKNTHSSSERKLSFTHRTSKSVDACNPSPSSDQSDPETRTEAGDKVTTSPKSALKSPSSRRKTSQNLKLRVTFDEPPRKDGAAGDTKAPSTKEKRPFGAFRSIMETLSGNQNNNNSNSSSSNAQSPGKHTGKKSKSKTSAV
ncbi:synphilin-1 isoform X1 [Danio rerio]|uniref:Synphilin-1 n=2 Tax=Danio rerio TaxID=7955 RepID=A8WGA8_DANRE|nr:synphilin-1 [Danio rerio]AAI54641.1 Zgc:172291 protein [Danio rerio]|eukprot:NP_001107108.1 synphilin-1 [Danio rerio]